MFEYFAFYNRKKITVQAETTYQAQLKAAEIFKAKKYYNVAIVPAASYESFVRTL